MTQNRYYSSTAVKTALTNQALSTDTSIVVGSVAGFPASLPYTLLLDPDQTNEEVVTVTAVAGTTLTVTRGADGTTAVLHAANAVVEHGVSARDFNEPQAHIANTEGAWTAWTPTLTNISGTDAPSGRYKLIGKTLIFLFNFGFDNTATATAQVSFTLPPGMTAAYGTGFIAYTNSNVPTQWLVLAGTGTVRSFSTKTAGASVNDSAVVICEIT